MVRRLLAGVAGGSVMFLWGALSHMVLQVGDMGLRGLPGEEALLATMRSSIPEPGVYFFPYLDTARDPTGQEMKEWEARYVDGPAGLIVYRPRGGRLFSPAQLAIEWSGSAAAALVAAWLLSWTRASYLCRVLACGMMGLAGWLAISLSHWNWYGFSGEFILGEGIDQVVGFLLAGLAIAAIVRGR